MPPRKERRRGSNNLEAIAGIKRVTRSRPIEFDAFNFPSLNQRCAKGMRGMGRVYSRGKRGVRRERERREKKDEADKRRYRESNTRSLSRPEVAEKFGPSRSSRTVFQGYRSFRRNGLLVRYEFENCRRGASPQSASGGK